MEDSEDGAESLDVGAESLDVGAESLDVGAESLDVGAESLDVGAESLKYQVWESPSPRRNIFDPVAASYSCSTDEESANP